MISVKTIAIFFIVAFASVQAATNPNATNTTTSVLQWSDAAFSSLLQNVTATSFSTAKLEAIKAGISSSPFGLAGNQLIQLYNFFSASSDVLALTQIIKNNTYGLTCQQLAYILKKVGFSGDKLEVLKSLVPYVSDRANKQAILDVFSSSSDKNQASQIIAASKSECYLFGEPHGNITFIIDVSNEIWGKFTLPDGTNMTRYDVLMSELARTIQGLNSSDYFTILPYDGVVYNTKAPLLPANQTNIDAAIAYLKALRPQNPSRPAFEGVQAAFQIPGVTSAYLVTYILPNPALVSYIPRWYASHPVTVNTIGLLMGTYSKVDKQATQNLLESIANVTNGTYKGIIYQ